MFCGVMVSGIKSVLRNRGFSDSVMIFIVMVLLCALISAACSPEVKHEPLSPFMGEIPPAGKPIDKKMYELTELYPGEIIIENYQEDQSGMEEGIPHKVTDSLSETSDSGVVGDITDRGLNVHQKVILSPRLARPGHEVPRLPEGYRIAWLQGEPFFYSHGVFYRPARSGFIIVDPPPGAVVVSLPVGYQRVWINKARYYVYGGVFYRQTPSGYEVVEVPADIVVKDDIPVIVEPADKATVIVSVTASVLNVRSGPSLSYPVIYQIQKGYILEIHGKTTGWFYVQLPNGAFGWVKQGYTSWHELRGHE